jgi:hypothetical protein
VDSELNPYAPSMNADHQPVGRDITRTVFFVVNFGVSVMFAIICAICILILPFDGGSLFDLASALLCIAPASAIAIAEWMLFARRSRRLERPLGILCGAVGGFTLYGFAGNLSEAAVEGTTADLSFWLVFAAISATIGAYALWCCWYRLRASSQWSLRG